MCRPNYMSFFVQLVRKMPEAQKANYFEARLLFIRQWKMYVAQVHKTNIARA
jgi:hypothetical protein